MADSKVTALTENTTPAAADLAYIIDDPGGTPASQKITLANLKTFINDLATAAIWDAAGDLVIGTGANTGSRLAIGTANQLLRVNSGATAPEWVSAGRVLISEQSPTGASVSWDNIPGGFNSLEVEIMGRTDKASVSVEGIYVYFNNDTTATNYYRQLISGATTTVSAAAADESNALGLPAATATANYAGYGLIRIPDYDGTTFHKIARLLSGRRETATTGFVGTQILFWESTSAITRVDLVTVSSGNFISGTKARLYGVY